MTEIKNRANRVTQRRQEVLDRLAPGTVIRDAQIAKLKERIYNAPTGIVKTKKDRSSKAKEKGGN